MQDIDFLPQRYREAQAQRTKKLWGMVVVLIYAGLLCTSGYLQKSSARQLSQDLAAANEQRAMVSTQAARLASLQKEVKEAQARAGLVAYLHHPWPRTQIVAAVVQPILEGLTLSELRVQRLESPQAVTRTQAVRPRAAANSAEAKADDRSPAERDNERVRETCDATSVIVTLKGAAEDVSLVHIYLGSLGKDSLFSRVDLMNIDGQDAQRQGGSGCRFTARLMVRPGYGQPSGPTIPPKPVPARMVRHLEARP
jgi:hypothetical protein